jgi:hypothetical protein
MCRSISSRPYRSLAVSYLFASEYDERPCWAKRIASHVQEEFIPDETWDLQPRMGRHVLTRDEQRPFHPQYGSLVPHDPRERCAIVQL